MFLNTCFIFFTKILNNIHVVSVSYCTRTLSVYYIVSLCSTQITTHKKYSNQTWVYVCV